jgi:hypothetical protein
VKTSLILIVIIEYHLNSLLLLNLSCYLSSSTVFCICRIHILLDNILSTIHHVHHAFIPLKIALTVENLNFPRGMKLTVGFIQKFLIKTKQNHNKIYLRILELLNKFDKMDILKAEIARKRKLLEEKNLVVSEILLLL